MHKLLLLLHNHRRQTETVAAVAAVRTTTTSGLLLCASNPLPWKLNDDDAIRDTLSALMIPHMRMFSWPYDFHPSRMTTRKSTHMSRSPFLPGLRTPSSSPSPPPVDFHKHQQRRWWQRRRRHQPPAPPAPPSVRHLQPPEPAVPNTCSSDASGSQRLTFGTRR